MDEGLEKSGWTTWHVQDQSRHCQAVPILDGEIITVPVTQKMLVSCVLVTKVNRIYTQFQKRCSIH